MRTQYKDASREYARALELAPNRPYLHLLYGNALKAAGDCNSAILRYQQAFQLDPKDPRGPASIGGCYYSSESYDKAEQHLKTAVELDPTYASALGQLALVYYAQKRHANAIPYFQRAIEQEKSPSKVASYRHALGWSFLSEKRYQEASDEFTKALQLDPKLQGAQDGLEAVKKAEAQKTPTAALKGPTR